MTKSKGIGRGGHREGAGRPPTTGKSEMFTTRITPALRDYLEAEAERRGMSVSAVAEDLIQIGIEAVAESRRTDPMKALLFFAERLGWGGRTGGKWNESPTEFAKFRAALLRLVDMLKPPGEPERPPPDELWDVPGAENWSTEDWVQFGARLRLGGLIEEALREIDAEQGRHHDLRTDETRRHYGFAAAARALGPDRLRGGRK